MLALGLTIASLSIAANIGYWTRGTEGLTYWINLVFAGLVEVLFIFLIWLAANIWKSDGKGLAVCLVALSIGPWFASSVSNFMFLATLNDGALAQSQATLSEATLRSLNADLERYDTQLAQYSDIVRKDVSSLEDRLPYCDKQPRERCDSTDLINEIAINRQINRLEADKAEALKGLTAWTAERKNQIKSGGFSIALLRSKLDGNLLSREFLMVVFLDLLKGVMFLIGLWISLRLYQAQTEGAGTNAHPSAQSSDVRSDGQQAISAPRLPVARKTPKKRASLEPAKATEPALPSGESKDVLILLDSKQRKNLSKSELAKREAKEKEALDHVARRAIIEVLQRQDDGSLVKKKKTIA